jgi:hypothetical protein
VTLPGRYIFGHIYPPALESAGVEDVVIILCIVGSAGRARETQSELLTQLFLGLNMLVCVGGIEQVRAIARDI